MRQTYRAVSVAGRSVGGLAIASPPTDLPATDTARYVCRITEIFNKTNYF